MPRKYQINLLRQWEQFHWSWTRIEESIHGDGWEESSIFPAIEWDGDWIWQHKNHPLASHIGRVWEPQIHLARAILGSLLKTHGDCSDDEFLLTKMTEAEGILNSRPLTVEVLDDQTDLQHLSTVNILTKKSKVSSPPTREFSKPDIYCRKPWWYIQHIVNDFCSHWKKEYLQSLPKMEFQKGKARKGSSKLRILS